MLNEISGASKLKVKLRFCDVLSGDAAGSGFDVLKKMAYCCACYRRGLGEEVSSPFHLLTSILTARTRDGSDEGHSDGWRSFGGNSYGVSP